MKGTWSWRRAAAALALGVAVLGVGAPSAHAHAQLEGSDPAPGAVVSDPPSAVTLTFNEAVDARLGAIRVYAADGVRVDEDRMVDSGDSKVVQAPLRRDALRNGTYIVVWRVQSVDGHPIQSAYTFSVGAPSVTSDAGRSLAARYLAANGSSSAVGAMTTVGRALAFSGLAVVVGAACAGLGWASSLRTIRRLSRIVWAGIVVTLAGTLLALFGQGAYAAGRGIGDVVRVDLLGDVLGTRYGMALATRLALLVLVGIWWWWARGSAARRTAVAPGVLLAVLLALTVSFAGHAATGPWPVIGVALDVVHVLAVDVWFGGLIVLAAAALVEQPVRWRDVQRFSGLALVSVVLIVLTGAAQGWRQLGSFDALTTTDYGIALIAKVMVFVCVLPFAVYARDLLRRRIDEPVLVGAPRPGSEPTATDSVATDDDFEDDRLDAAVVQRRLRRSLFVEIGFLLVVFALTAVLTGAVPGREERTGPVNVLIDVPMVSVAGTISPGTLGPNEVHLSAYSPEGAPLDTTAMVARLRRDGIGYLDIPLRRLGTGHYYSPQFVIPQKGAWTLVVIVDIDAFTRTSMSQSVEIR